MDQECDGSGFELPVGPPADEATACPVCGRATRVEGHEVDGDMRFTIEPHQPVLKQA